jgi:hypothetical protein
MKINKDSMKIEVCSICGNIIETTEDFIEDGQYDQICICMECAEGINEVLRKRNIESVKAINEALKKRKENENEYTNVLKRKTTGHK